MNYLVIDRILLTAKRINGLENVIVYLWGKDLETLIVVKDIPLSEFAGEVLHKVKEVLK